MNRHGRRPRFRSPLTEARDRIVGAVMRPLRWFRPTTRFVLCFLALAAASTLLLARTRSAITSAEAYQEGDVVRADVVAPADISSTDARATEARREAARRETPPVWSYDPTQIESSVQSFRALWAALKQQSDSRASNNANGPGSNAPHDLVWPGVAADRTALARAVAAHNFDAGALEVLSHMMRDTAGGYVYDERDAEGLAPEVRLADVRGGADASSAVEQSRLTPITAVRQSLRGRVSELAGWRPSERELLASAMLPLLRPSVTFDRGATAQARDAAARLVSPVMVVLKRNQTVAREGDTVTPQMLGQFAAIRDYSHTERRPQLFIGLLDRKSVV